MDSKKIIKRSLKLIIFGISVFLILKVVPVIKLNNNEILMIVSYVSVIQVILSNF